jgi:hypothetical protein
MIFLNFRELTDLSEIGEWMRNEVLARIMAKAPRRIFEDQKLKFFSSSSS